MKTKLRLLESTPAPTEIKKVGSGVYEVTIISEGKGTSGLYNAEAVRSASQVFKAGTLMFMNHPIDPSRPEHRDMSSLMAKTITDPVLVQENGIAKAKAQIKVNERYRDYVEEYWENLGLSIFALSEGYRDDEDNFVVDNFDVEDPFRSVDFVIAAGRGGAIDRMIESYNEISGSTPSADSSATPVVADNDEGENMQEVLDAVARVKESFEGTLGDILARVASLETAASEASTGKAEQVTVLEAAKALSEAELSDKAVERVAESVKGGGNILDAINREKAIRDEYTKAPEDGGEIRIVTESDRRNEGDLSARFDALFGEAK